MPFCAAPLWMVSLGGEEDEFSSSVAVSGSREPETKEISGIPVSATPTSNVWHHLWRITVRNQAAGLMAIAAGNAVALGLRWLLEKNIIQVIVEFVVVVVVVVCRW